MTFEEFLTICESTTVPPNISRFLKALWYDRTGEWDLAHEEIQDGEDPHSAAIHAYLHRKEGDLSNARYWYSTANRRPFKGTLDEEWESLARELVKR
jgi:hypothetical protein